MITILKTDTIKIEGKKFGQLDYMEIRGLSTDEKPLTIKNKEISNGSIFIEIDTGKIFLFDAQNKLWKEI